MTAKRSKKSGIFEIVKGELASYPGRLSGSLRDTLGITIALLVAMTLRVPGISLALALLFLMQRERPGLTRKAGLQILSGAALASIASLVWVQMSDGIDVARFLGILFGIFAAAFCIAATTIPLLFTIFGFYWFLDLSAWDAHRTPDVIVTSILYNLAALAIVTTSIVAVEYLFGTRHPADDLVREVRNRITVLSRFFHVMANEQAGHSTQEFRSLHTSLVQYAHAGDFRMNELYDRLRDSSSDLSLLPLGIHYRIGLLTRILEKSALIGLERHRTVVDRSHYAVISAQCDRLLEDNSGPSLLLPTTAPVQLKDIYAELQAYAASLRSPEQSPAPVLRQTVARSFSIFITGAFRTPAHVAYALKLTLAASLCYVLYNAVAWPGILTCVVTVLFTGLSSTGAMKQKQLYRFSGAAVGAAIGIATVSLLFPNMDSITSLVLVVAAVSFLSGWVLRSPRIGYVGVQIGFAFFLVALPGFSAATEIAPARDRVIGVALGIVVMWVIFDQIWPRRTSTVLLYTLRRIRHAATQLRQAAAQQDMAETERILSHLRVAVSLELANVQQLDSAVYFDFGHSRRRELVRSRSLIRDIEVAAAEFYSEALRLEASRQGRPLKGLSTELN